MQEYALHDGLMEWALKWVTLTSSHASNTFTSFLLSPLKKIAKGKKSQLCLKSC
jgi:hypothetical protein